MLDSNPWSCKGKPSLLRTRTQLSPFMPDKNWKFSLKMCIPLEYLFHYNKKSGFSSLFVHWSESKGKEKLRRNEILIRPLGSKKCLNSFFCDKEPKKIWKNILALNEMLFTTACIIDLDQLSEMIIFNSILIISEASVFFEAAGPGH